MEGNYQLKVVVSDGVNIGEDIINVQIKKGKDVLRIFDIINIDFSRINTMIFRLLKILEINPKLFSFLQLMLII